MPLEGLLLLLSTSYANLNSLNASNQLADVRVCLFLLLRHDCLTTDDQKSPFISLLVIIFMAFAVLISCNCRLLFIVQSTIATLLSAPKCGYLLLLPPPYYVVGALFCLNNVLYNRSFATSHTNILNNMLNQTSIFGHLEETRVRIAQEGFGGVKLLYDSITEHHDSIAIHDRV